MAVATQSRFEVAIPYAGRLHTRTQIRGTIALLGYYRQFLASDHELCVNRESEWRTDKLTRDQARRRLGFLVNVAINRKAGIPDVVGRKQDPDHQMRVWRDCRMVRDRINKRIAIRQFETREIGERYGHLLSDSID